MQFHQYFKCCDICASGYLEQSTWFTDRLQSAPKPCGTNFLFINLTLALSLLGRQRDGLDETAAKGRNAKCQAVATQIHCAQDAAHDLPDKVGSV